MSDRDHTPPPEDPPVVPEAAKSSADRSPPEPDPAPPDEERHGVRPPATDSDSAHTDSPAEEDVENEDLPPEQRLLPVSGLRTFVDFRLEDNDVEGPMIAGLGDGMTAQTINIGIPEVERRPFHIAKIPSSQLEEIQATYVDTEADSELDSKLKIHRLVFLDGKPGTGRETSAYHALIQRRGGGQLRSINLAHDTRLDQAVPDLVKRLRTGCGYLLRLPVDQPLTDAAVARLAQVVADRDASVLLIDRPAQLPASLDQYRVPHRPPEPSEVLRRHLGYRLADECLAECVQCTGQCVAEYTEMCLSVVDISSVIRPAECADIAEHLARDKLSKAEISTVVRQRLMVHPRNQALRIMEASDGPEGPYREQRTQHQRAFRICYAMFHGKPLRDVFMATEILRRCLDRCRGWEMYGDPTYHLSTEELLGPDLAAMTEDHSSASPGAGPIALVRNERLVRAIIEVAWNHYGGFQKPLLNLLDVLVGQHDARIRQQVALVAGTLAGYDFSLVCDKLIRKWAKSEKPRSRQAAAWAMEAAALSEDGLRELVREQVGYWVRGSWNRNRDTAARVYATRYGRMFPDEGMRDLKKIADDPMQRRTRTISDAVTRLASCFTPADLFHELARWMDPPNSSAASHGVRIFVRLATEPDRTGSGVPELMRLLYVGHIDVDQLALIWRCALAWPPTARAAWSTLENWIEVSDHDVESVTFQRMLCEIFHTPALRKRGRFHLTYVWKRNPTQGAFKLVSDIVAEES